MSGSERIGSAMKIEHIYRNDWELFMIKTQSEWNSPLKWPQEADQNN